MLLGAHLLTTEGMPRLSLKKCVLSYSLTYIYIYVKSYEQVSLIPLMSYYQGKRKKQSICQETGQKFKLSSFSRQLAQSGPEIL